MKSLFLILVSAFILSNVCLAIVIKVPIWSSPKHQGAPNSDLNDDDTSDEDASSGFVQSKRQPNANRKRREFKKPQEFNGKEKPEHLVMEEKLKSLQFIKLIDTKSGIFQYNKPHFVKISVGTPPQTFFVRPIFHSSNVWLIDNECDSKECQGAYHDFTKKVYDRNLFDKNASTTYEQLEEIEDMYYLKFIANQAFDEFSMAENVSYSQSFMLAFEINQYLRHFVGDGELGLAHPRLSLVKNKQSVLGTMSKIIDQNIFTLWINGKVEISLQLTFINMYKKNVKMFRGIFPDINPTAEPQNNGQITFGALDDEHCASSDWKFLSLSTNKYMSASYIFRVNGFRVNNYDNHRNYLANVYPGIPFIMAQPLTVQLIAAEIGAELVPFQRSVFSDESDDSSEEFEHHVKTAYIIDCQKENLPNIYIKLGDFELTVTPKDYVLDISEQIDLGPGKCLFGFVPFESNGYGPSWIFGEIFLQNYCVAFDFGSERIGFAKVK